ncbi:type II secretion system F family protein [Brevibacterium sp. R8603A2]|uniref:type II secretion system F family protein n=1 Tax=unclassified Brevibacterium TaxID=2614124 RepID=UPI001FFC1088|nr:type II secretion system F family protein [Brevibacterium sp. R8603A2]MCK1801830.1 type II secretion system F family protein [Brevibacterium sp. R8603A2]
MRELVILGALFGVLAVAAIGFSAFMVGSLEKRELVRNQTETYRRSFRARFVTPVNRWFIGTRIGRRLDDLMLQANVTQLTPVEFVLIGLVIVVVVGLSLNTVMATFYAVMAGVLIVVAMVYALTILRHKQREKFIAQLPEFARILANATGAGLSINTALHIAATELSDPAGREIRRMTNELDLGTPMDIAFERLERRLPGKDLSVLVSTLVIAHRSGGSLITALRDLSLALEDRKETTREVRTLVAEASYTGYMVAGLGVGLVIILSLTYNDLLLDLTSTVIGQIAIVITTASYIIGIVAINRLTRVKL